MKRPVIIAIAASLAILLLAACGGGEEAAPTALPASTATATATPQPTSAQAAPATPAPTSAPAATVVPTGAPTVVQEPTATPVATDNVGNIGTTTRSFRVGADAAPTVSITSPKGGEELRAGDSITVEVLADDNGEVVSVAGAVTESGGRTALVFEEFPQMDWRSNPFTVPDGQD